jgi:hypothetical protein
MTEDEIKELSEIKSSKKGCCSFCSSKCPTCGSVDISAIYYRQYDFDQKEMKFSASKAEVICNKCHAKKVEPSEWPTGICSSKPIITITSGCAISKKLAKQLDKHFEKNKCYTLPAKIIRDISIKDIDTFIQVYEYDNSDRNHITINSTESYCLDSSGDEGDSEVTDTLASLTFISEVNIECKDDPSKPGKHYVIKTEHYTLER